MISARQFAVKFFSNYSKMVKQHKVNGYEEFCKFVDGLPQPLASSYFFLFTGSMNADGQSWCPDCVEAHPVIHDALSLAPENSNFVEVFVGNREVWKDRNCAFRKDSRTKLMVIPTLIKWKAPQRLEGEKCANKDIVEMMFTDEDED